MKKRTNSTVSGAKYRTFNQIANVCPLVSVHDTDWYSVRNCAISAVAACACAEVEAAVMFLASPPSPGARERNFLAISMRPVAVADEMVEETVDAALLTGIGMRTGTVYETKRWTAA